MKLGQFFKKMVGGSMILAAMACPVFTSCYDDSKLWAEMGKVKDQVASLESRLNDQLAALQYMLGADSKIKDVKWDDTNKKWKFTLADGTTFDFAPLTNAENQQKFQSLITTVEVDGAKYWATYGADGTANALTDADGNMYPVSVTPQVKTEDGVTYLSLDGETWVPTCSNPSVFVDVEVVYTDNFTDEEEAEGLEEYALYVIFSLADGNTITLTLDGAAGIVFGDPYGMSRVPEYIMPGATVDLPISFTNIENYIIQAPTGWVVEEKILETEYYKEVYLSVTAPTAKAIADKYAPESGLLKVLGIPAGGGKSVTASTFITAKPFRTIAGVRGVVTLEPYNGLNGFFYNVAPADGWDAAATYNEIVTAFEEAGNPYQMWEYLSDQSTVQFDMGTGKLDWDDTPIIAPLTVGSSYVVWAIPYTMDAKQNWSLGAIETAAFSYITCEIESDVKWNDIIIEADLKGVESYYAGFTNKDSFYGIEDILSSFGGYSEPSLFEITTPYSGTVLEFAETYEPAISPDTEYVLWVIPAIEGKTSFTEDDVYMYEFTTPGLSSGASIQATLGDDTANAYNRFVVDVTAEGAEMICYAWILPENKPTIAGEEAAYILANGQRAIGSEVTVYQSYIPGTFNSLMPNTSAMLLAMAVDAEGKYGEVAYKVYTTKDVSFNDVVVTLEMVGEPSVDGTKFKVVTSSASGLTPDPKYLVYAGTEDTNRWLNTYGGSKETAEKYFAMNPEYYYAVDGAPQPDAEGIITVNSTDYLTDYVICVSARVKVDNKWTVSRAAYHKFQISFDLGDNFVPSKDANGNENQAWLEKKPTVNITTETVGDFTHVNWTVTDIPEGFTAQTVIFHDDYLAYYPSDKDKANFLLTSSVIYLEDVSPKGHSYPSASSGYNIYVLIKDAEGNYYAPYKYECNITGGFGV